MNFEQTSEYKYLLEFYTPNQILNYTKHSSEKLIELFNATQPKKIKIASLKGKTDNALFLVSSPDGWVPVTDCIEKQKDALYEFHFTSGRKITASHDHLYQMPDQSWHFARDLQINDILLAESDSDQISKIIPRTKNTKVYDLSVNHNNHRYYTNGICSHNSGKSLFMQNISVNWITQGLNGVYLTLELSEELTAMRIDSMIANISTREIFKHLDDVELKVGMAQKKSGHFQVKYLNAQSNVNDIRAYVREYQIQTGTKPDFLMVDYLDLLMPAGVKIDPTNLFVKDKYVSEELRSLAKELNVLFITASQFGRGAVDEVEFDHADISGGISKINTADNVFGIFTSRAMRERGKYQLQLLKTRSSSGVGSKVDLDFNLDSLRITDSGEESVTNTGLASNILGKIKPKSTIITTSAVDTIDNSDKLKSMLAGLKK